MSTPIFDALVREQPLPPGTLLEERMQNRPLEDEVYYPDITVPLVGGSRSAGAIIEKVAAALRHYLRDGIDGLPAKDWSPIIQQFRAEAMSGSYDDLLRTCMRWVHVE